MSAITKQADSGFGSIELSLPRNSRESALCNTQKPSTLRRPAGGKWHPIGLRRDQVRCLSWVKRRNTRGEQMFSALPPKADIAQCSRHVRKAPRTEVQKLIRSPRRRAAEMTLGSSARGFSLSAD